MIKNTNGKASDRKAHCTVCAWGEKDSHKVLQAIYEHVESTGHKTILETVIRREYTKTNLINLRKRNRDFIKHKCFESAKKYSDHPVFDIRIGERMNVQSGESHINLAMITDYPQWEDTEIVTHHDFDSKMRQALETTPEGRATYDFYIYEVTGDLVCNVQAYFNSTGLQRMTEDELTLWERKKRKDPWETTRRK